MQANLAPRIGLSFLPRLGRRYLFYLHYMSTATVSQSPKGPSYANSSGRTFGMLSLWRIGRGLEGLIRKSKIVSIPRILIFVRDRKKKSTSKRKDQRV